MDCDTNEVHAGGQDGEESRISTYFVEGVGTIKVCNKCTFQLCDPSESSYYCRCEPGDGPIPLVLGPGEEEGEGAEGGVASVDGSDCESADEDEEMEEDDSGHEKSVVTSRGKKSSGGVESRNVVLNNIKSPGRNFFDNLKEASDYIMICKHEMNVEDDDWEEIMENPKPWYQKLYDAMITRPKDVPDTDKDDSSWAMIQNKGFTQKHIQASAWALIIRTLNIHRYGSELEQTQLQGRSIDHMKASERLNMLVDILYHKKNVVKDVLDSFKLRLVVDQPTKRLARSKQTWRGNKNKKDVANGIKEELEQYKAKQGNSFAQTSSDAERIVSSSSKSPCSTPSSGSTSPDVEDGGEEVQEGEEGAGTKEKISDGWTGGSSPPLPDASAGVTFTESSDETMTEPGGVAGPTTRSAGKKGKAPASRGKGGNELTKKAPGGRKPKQSRD